MQWFEESRKRIDIAERACEREMYPEPRNKSWIKADKRMRSTKLRKNNVSIKLQKQLTKYLGAENVVRAVMTGTGNRKKSYYFLCEYCKESYLGSNFVQHLVAKHKFSTRKGKMLQSKLRVLYLWILKNKKGVQRPLPCESCGIWHLRLDNHLKLKHNDLTDMEHKALLFDGRKKYWMDEEKHGSTEEEEEEEAGESESFTAGLETFTVRAKQPSLVAASNLHNYIPENAHSLTDVLRQKYGIKNHDFFDIYYKTAEELLNAFETHLTDIGLQNASQHRRHSEYIWNVLDDKKQIFPTIIFSNIRVVQDMYHRKCRRLVGNGGVEASTLKVRFGSLKRFLSFIRSQGIYAGISRDQVQRLLDSIDDWNDELKKMVSKRKVKLRGFKLKHLMTAKHMIGFGRSNHVQTLIRNLKCLENTQNSSKSQIVNRKFALQVRNYLMCYTSIMNGLRASNLIELTLKDVENYSTNKEYPGQIIIRNDTYKTATIYGEKLVVIPSTVFTHLQIYIRLLRPMILESSSQHLFVVSSSKRKCMSSADVGSALTASFKMAQVFTKNEYQRVCPTRIRVACATYACNVEGIDMGYFANTFMKNRKSTTAWHYNLYSSNREALSLAMMVGNSFLVGGKEVFIKKEEREELTQAITKYSFPKKENVIEWIKNHNPDVEQKELKELVNILQELSADHNKNASRFYDKDNGEEMTEDNEERSGSEDEMEEDQEGSEVI